MNWVIAALALFGIPALVMMPVTVAESVTVWRRVGLGERQAQPDWLGLVIGLALLTLATTPVALAIGAS